MVAPRITRGMPRCWYLDDDMRELKIYDLSVGDWVMVKGKAVKVESLGKIRDYVELEGFLALCHIKVVQPIPITPEILEKNRLDFKEFAFEETTMLGRHIRRIVVSKSDRGWWIHVSIRNAGGHDFVDMVFAVDFIGQFVHELQHALRLAGIEKEIEL